MLVDRIARGLLIGLGLVAVCGGFCRTLAAQDLYLSDGRVFPGQLWLSRSGEPERSLYRRQPTADPAYPRAAMKLGSVAVGPDRKIYYCSGLDGYVMHLLDGRHEILSFEFDGQVRDVDCASEAHTVYFSVVPTPQNGEPLADGKIYRRDIWAGQPSEVAAIRQSQVGGNWWGTFAIRDGVVYLATFENPSRILKLTSGGPEPFATASFKIHGLATASDGSFYFTDGTDKVYRTTDFQTSEPVLRASRIFTDVSVAPTADVTP